MSERAKVEPEDVEVYWPGSWENDQGPLDWWAVSTEHSGGIIAYARDEETAWAIKELVVEGRIPP